MPCCGDEAGALAVLAAASSARLSTAWLDGRSDGLGLALFARANCDTSSRENVAAGRIALSSAFLALPTLSTS